VADYCLNSADFDVVRFSALTATGEEQYGANAQAVTAAGISLGISPQVTEGTVSEVKNGRGTLCGRKKGANTVAAHTLTLQTCKLEPELHYLIAGGQTIEETGSIIGWAQPDPDAAQPNGVVVEAYSLAWDGEAQATYEGEAAYWLWAWPLTRWTLGDINLVEGIHTFTWTADATPNPVLGRGPENNWPEAISGPFGHWLVPASDVPSAYCGVAANAS
jgi:hypothetical protein